ncbi:hypothetical protein ACK09Q_000806 [Campylobacter upsaliensis]
MEYCKREFDKFRNTLYVNPFSNEKESRYSDDEICNLEFHF